MEIIDIAGHSVDKSILGDGVIIDVGCRGFAFASHDLFKNNQVHAIDCDADVFNDGTWFGHQNMIFPHNLAISDKEGEAYYYKNGEATCLKELDPARPDLYGTCKTITMEQLYEITGTNVDVLKLDCEGGEYVILGETFKPIPKQITVEFHYHCFPERHMKEIDGILQRLKKDYDVVKQEWTQMHGAGFNFWDSLFIRKY